MIPDSKRAKTKQNDNKTPSVDQSRLIPQLDFNEEIMAKMAADPEIQKEMQLINAEFAETEEDGLSD